MAERQHRNRGRRRMWTRGGSEGYIATCTHTENMRSMEGKKAPWLNDSTGTEEGGDCMHTYGAYERHVREEDPIAERQHRNRGRRLRTREREQRWPS